jgi:hypothetical protein
MQWCTCGTARWWDTFDDSTERTGERHTRLYCTRGGGGLRVGSRRGRRCRGRLGLSCTTLHVREAGRLVFSGRVRRGGAQRGGGTHTETQQRERVNTYECRGVHAFLKMGWVWMISCARWVWALTRVSSTRIIPVVPGLMLGCGGDGQCLRL